MMKEARRQFDSEYCGMFMWDDISAQCVIGSEVCFLDSMMVGWGGGGARRSTSDSGGYKRRNSIIELNME